MIPIRTPEKNGGNPQINGDKIQEREKGQGQTTGYHK